MRHISIVVAIASSGDHPTRPGQTEYDTVGAEATKERKRLEVEITRTAEDIQKRKVCLFHSQEAVLIGGSCF